MTRTAAHPYDDGRTPSRPAERGMVGLPPQAPPHGVRAPALSRSERTTTAARPSTAPLPALEARTGHHGERWTALLPQQRHRASEPREASTEPLPAIGRPGGGSASRVRGVDAARGLALLGMMAVHTLPATDDDGGVTTVGLVAGGTSAALFGVLAGVSVALLTGRRRVGADAAGRHALRLAVRGLVVGVLGLALGEAALGSVDIILTYYGVLFLLAVPLILLPTRALFALGAAIAVIAPVTSFLVRAGLPASELIDPSFTALINDPGGLLTLLLFTGAYPIWPWLAYLCVGIAVGRCSLAHTRTAAALAASGVLLVVAAAVVSHLALVSAGGLGHILANPGLPAEELQAALTKGPNGVTPTSTWWWLAVDTAHSSTPLDLARTMGTSLAAIGAMLLFDRALARGGSTPPARVVGAARAPLAAAGSMTLTFYTLHVVFVGIAPEADPWLLYLFQVAFALLVGLLWQRFVGRGPLEAAVSTLTDAVVPSPTSSRSAHGSAPNRPGRTILVAAIALSITVGGAVAVAAGRSSDTSPPAATTEQIDGPESDAGQEGPTQPGQPGGTDERYGADEQGQPDPAGEDEDDD